MSHGRAEKERLQRQNGAACAATRRMGWTYRAGECRPNFTRSRPADAAPSKAAERCSDLPERGMPDRWAATGPVTNSASDPTISSAEHHWNV